MNKPLQRSVHKEQQAQIDAEMHARELVAYNVIIKAETFMRSSGQQDLADKWVRDMLETEASTNPNAEIEQ